ncbi:MAG: metal ABC transporter permease [Planctomycetota bacterium]|nr:metal ABC transporter permease [Planctomycetota bacterium]
MSPMLQNFLTLDLPALLTAMFAGVSCALLGTFLLLRRQSLMGDAISHSVLPGIVAAFLLTGSRDPLVMFGGAALAGVVSAGLVELVRRAARLEAGAAMGVVFPVLFALGVLLLERGGARSVDLDADCVLYGELSRIIWSPPSGVALGSSASLAALPRELYSAGIVSLVASVFVALLFKELRLVSFDAALATSLGFRASVLNLLMLILTAAAVVVSFEAVGSILVVALLICPAASARLFTDRLSRQLWLSLGFAVLTVLAGYAAAVWFPLTWGSSSALSASGMIAAMSGVGLGIAIIVSPKGGVVLTRWRRFELAVRVAREDMLARLYREEETPGRTLVIPTPSRIVAAAARRDLRRLGMVEGSPPRLTAGGRTEAQTIVRSHRLWETYLVHEVGLRPDHVHDPALVLEHLRKSGQPIAPSTSTPVDPHDRPIP